MKIFYPYSEVLPSEKARALQVVNTVCAMAKAGVEVELFAGLKKTDTDILNMYGLTSNSNLNFIPGATLRRRNFFGFKISCGSVFYRSSIRYLKKKEDKNFVIYTRHLKLAAVLLKKFPDIPLVYEAHEVFSMERHSLFHLEKFVFNNAKGIVSISHSLIKKVREFYSLNAPVAIIPDGVNRKIIEQEQKRKIHGDVVYVGQLYPWKGVKTLVTCMKYLPEVNLTIVGGGSEKETREIDKLVDKFKLRDRVRLTGFLPYQEALRFMTGARVLVLPLENETISRYFTSPLKLFEYMACHVPIVASDFPTIREILRDESALFVRPGDAEDLAAAIKKLLKDESLAQTLADNAYIFSKDYSWSKRAERIINLLEGI